MARSYATGAWEAGNCSDYVSRLFCVKKPPGPDGKERWRLVLDLRPLNLYCRDHKMSMESLKSLTAMGLRPESLMFSWDLQDGFHCCGIAKEDRKYMTFHLLGQLHQIAAVPFGWTSSPYVFGQIMAVLVRLLRGPGLPSESDVKHGMRGNHQLQRAKVLRVGGVRRALYLMHEMPP